MLALLHNNIKVTFEDKGQDYLSWVIDKDGYIVDSQPHHDVALSEIKVLDKVFFKNQKILYLQKEQKLSLPFRVIKFEEII
jgi:hypothetical protein